MMLKYWWILLVGPVVTVAEILILWWVARQTRAIYEWYRGLPLYQWPAMMLIVLGSRGVRGKYCKFMRYENRFWISPEVAGFNVDINKEP